MDRFVTDTQALVKFMTGKRVINDRVHQIFLSTDKGDTTIIIPVIVLMEILYLFEKNRIPVDLLQIEDLLKSKNYQVEPLSLEILKVASEITDIPEMHDRLIDATARFPGIPLITNDPVILHSQFADTVK